jgi:ribosome-associated heat shock protein Hsp15
LSESLRIDKWLWHARFCKTRAIAQAKAAQGRIRLNGNRVEKPSANVKVGDVLTLPAGDKVMSLRVLGLGLRRGPAAEAQSLYELIEDKDPLRH